MKVVKAFIFIGFLSAIISGCFDQPQFSIIPEIFFEKIIYKKGNGLDSLILTIKFRDGDGDLGLAPENLYPAHSDYPYNEHFFYLATGTGDTLRVATKKIENNIVVMRIPGLTGTGKLVNDKTRDQPFYSYLPAYDNNDLCGDYVSQKILVPDSLKAVDDSYNILRTVTLPDVGKCYEINDPLLYKKNLNHYNIEVRFYTLEGEKYEEYNWGCDKYNYFSRFPYLAGEKRPLEGTIRYGMTHPSFLNVFSVKTLILRIRIRDRAGHISREVATHPFTIKSIEK
jgi:hypothetical protein